MEADALVMEVRKTSNAKLYPEVTGFSVPQGSLKALQFLRTTYHWRLVGVAVGAVAGLGVLAARIFTSKLELFAPTRTSGGDVLALGAGLALPVVGYFVGRSSDKHTTDIVIVP